ncbi:MAG TPA: Flp family type IVb pilin [Firmicutes bacterium]|nr:Flp family type IVb pilin [Bacillota bacterium]
MKWISFRLPRLRRDQTGATTAEYALILALVVIVLISTLTELGNVLKAKLIDIINQISSAS